MNPQRPLISVVIPAFNEEKYLPECLKALQNQQFNPTDYEIIVVDNNSIDRTSEIAKKFGVRLIFEKKQGGVFAYDQGIRSANAEIIAVTDADSKPEPDWLEKIVTIFNSSSEVAITGLIIIDTRSVLLSKILGFLYEIFLRFNFFIGKPHLSGFNFAVLKKVYLGVGGLNQDFQMSSDVDLGLRLKKLGKVGFHKELKVKTSNRRWKGNLFGTLFDYTKGYFYTVWLRRPSKVVQKVVR